MARHALLGDLHGDFPRLAALVASHPDWSSATLLGDVGVGLPGHRDPPARSAIPVRFIRGNHDDPTLVRQLPASWAAAGWTYLPDGHLEDGVLHVGGAFSLDHAARTAGVDWWLDEELDADAEDTIVDRVRRHPARIHTVLSHDAPFDLYPALGVRSDTPTRTSSFLRRLWHTALRPRGEPDRWFFAHHHRRWCGTRDGVTFRCLDMEASGDVTYL